MGAVGLMRILPFSVGTMTARGREGLDWPFTPCLPACLPRSVYPQALWYVIPWDSLMPVLCRLCSSSRLVIAY